MRANLLNQRERAILASFVFCPMGLKAEGRTGSNIAQVSKTVFYSLFQYPRRNNHVPWTANVTFVCRSLQKRGYLWQTGLRKWSHGMREGYSPMFNITEAGLLYVMANCEQDHLPDAQETFDVYHKRNLHVMWRTDNSFKAFLREDL